MTSVSILGVSWPLLSCYQPQQSSTAAGPGGWQQQAILDEAEGILWPKSLPQVTPAVAPALGHPWSKDACWQVGKDLRAVLRAEQPLSPWDTSSMLWPCCLAGGEEVCWIVLCYAFIITFGKYYKIWLIINLEHTTNCKLSWQVSVCPPLHPTIILVRDIW